jgi:phosphoserine phosphatase RsbU/P
MVGVLQVLNKHTGTFGDDDVGVATALAAQCAVAIQRMKLLEDMLARQRMERELEVAKDIQTRVFPKTMPTVAGYELAGWSRPADQTGGDIFDIIETGGRVVLLLGDATGHGIGPALSVTQVRAMLRICVRLGAGLDDSFRHINDQLSDDLSANRFVTGFLAVFDPSNHQIVYHSGGQGPILHYHAAKREATLAPATTLPMGMMPVLSLKAPRIVAMEPGDVLAAITDGIYEYENPQGEMFGEKRVVSFIRDHSTMSADELLKALVAEVDAFAAGAEQKDDMTLVFVKRL